MDGKKKLTLFLSFLIFILPFSIAATYNLVSDYNNPLTRSLGDKIYCLVENGCGDDKTLNLYIDSSPYTETVLNISEFPDQEYTLYVHTGEIFVLNRDII